MSAKNIDKLTAYLDDSLPDMISYISYFEYRSSAKRRKTKYMTYAAYVENREGIPSERPGRSEEDCVLDIALDCGFTPCGAIGSALGRDFLRSLESEEKSSDSENLK